MAQSSATTSLVSDENGTVSNRKPPPRRQPNSERRSREYLTPQEVEHLMDAARVRGRHGHRDATMILIGYRHGLRVSELVGRDGLRWDQVDFRDRQLHVTRLKNGVRSVHPLGGDELRALRRLRREQPDARRYVFETELLKPMTASGFRMLLTRIGIEAGMPFPVHPHMLRHACGYKLANEGHNTRALQHYLGHRNIQHTVRYSELSDAAFVDFWK
jgi:site-specific recombinase XerD